MKRLICLMLGHVSIVGAYCPVTESVRPVCLYCRKGME